jgi:hypothetical protein
MWHSEPQDPDPKLFGYAGSGYVLNEYDPQPCFDTQLNYTFIHQSQCCKGVPPPPPPPPQTLATKYGKKDRSLGSGLGIRTVWRVSSRSGHTVDKDNFTELHPPFHI